MRKLTTLMLFLVISVFSMYGQDETQLKWPVTGWELSTQEKMGLNQKYFDDMKSYI